MNMRVQTDIRELQVSPVPDIIDAPERALLASLDEHVTQPIVDRAPAVCVRMSCPRSALRHEALYRRFLQHHTAARPTHHA